MSYERTREILSTPPSYVCFAFSSLSVADANQREARVGLTDKANRDACAALNMHAASLSPQFRS